MWLLQKQKMQYLKRFQVTRENLLDTLICNVYSIIYGWSQRYTIREPVVYNRTLGRWSFEECKPPFQQSPIPLGYLCRLMGISVRRATPLEGCGIGGPSFMLPFQQSPIIPLRYLCRPAGIKYKAATPLWCLLELPRSRLS